MRAVITAGGTVDGAFAQRIGTPVKALAPLRGRTLLDTAIDACTGAGIDGIAVVGGAEVRDYLRRARPGVRTIDAAEDGAANVLRALDAWRGDRFAYLTSDLPFADARGLADLIERSAPFDLTMGIASTAAYDARFPNAPPYGVRLGAERLVNACAFVIGAAAAGPVRDAATQMFDARKSPLRMALLLGPTLLMRFALKRLTVTDIERHASQRLGIRAAAVRDADPGLCYDVDTLAEYEYAVR